MEETIDLKDYFNIIKKNLKKIISITLSTGVVGALLAFLAKPEEIVKEEREYDSEARIIVSDNSQELSNYINSITDKQDVRDELNKAINDNHILAKNYSMMIYSDKVLQEVINNLNLDTSVQEFRRNFNINIWPNDNTNIIKIYTKAKEEQKLVDDVANEIVKVFKEQNPKLSVEIVQEAVEPTLPVPLTDANGKPLPEKEEEEVTSPRVSIKKVVMNGVIGVVLGGMISLFIVFMKEYMDNKLRTAKQVTDILGLEVLGVIPKEGDK